MKNKLRKIFLHHPISNYHAGKVIEEIMVEIREMCEKCREARKRGR